MAKKSTGGSESPVPRSEPTSRVPTPLPAAQVDSTDQQLTPAPDAAVEPLNDVETMPIDATNADTATQATMPQEEDIPTQPVLEASAIPSRRSSEGADDTPNLQALATRNIAEERKEQITPSVIDSAGQSFEKMQQEIDGYIERVDALQAKLAYLTKDATESARRSASAAGKGSLEQILAEKDEKIALLMAAGQSLSKTEMKHLATIKKVRGQIATMHKDQASLKNRAEKAERTIPVLEDRAKRAESISKRTAEEDVQTSARTSADSEAMMKERQALTATIADIKAQLGRANHRADQAEERAQLDLLEKEKKKSDQLQGDLTSARLEREFSEEKLRREIKDLQATVTHEKEQARVQESEMLSEQAVLESKLESFRARAEEASSSDSGETHAKLLRHIETLQTQYSSASQNWQGIEGSLLSRIAALEKERDDAITREGDWRKRLKDISHKLKQKDREVEQVNDRIVDMERRLYEAQDEAQRSQKDVQQLTNELTQSKAELEGQRHEAEKQLTSRIEEERAKWHASISVPRLDSPGISSRKVSGLDISQFINPGHTDRPQSRRSSNMHGFGHGSSTPPPQSVMPPLRTLTNGTNMPETPSIIMSNDDEYFANVPITPASPNHTPPTKSGSGGIHDIMSTSTAGAGPSVQLVERMSANVRRLESEKAASRDEIARLGTQRDEARQQLVSLMQEIEAKRAVDTALKKLETEHGEMAKRYQTTLEMLGEKSEMVEELKADVADVKAMYRELVDTVGK